MSPGIPVWDRAGSHGAALFSLAAQQPCAMPKCLLGELQNNEKQLRFGGFP